MGKKLGCLLIGALLFCLPASPSSADKPAGLAEAPAKRADGPTDHLPASLATENDPDFLKAHQLYEKGQYPAAIRIYQQLLGKNKLDLASRYELARSYLAIGHYEQVENTLEFLTTLTQNDFAAFKAGQLLDIARGLWLYATRTGEKKLFHAVNGTILPRAEQLAKTPELYIFWGNCYLDKGDAPAARDAFKDALKIDPQNAAAYLGLARVAFNQSPDKALPVVNKALKFDPNLAGANALRAVIHLVNERYGEASTDIEKALTVNPNSLSFRGTLASIYYLTNEIKKFEAECQDVLEINPKPAIFYYQLGNNCLKRLLYMEAQPFYEKAIDFDQKLWEAVVAAGMNYLHLGPKAEIKGRKILEKVFERDPFNVPVHNTLKMLDALEDEFETVASEHFRIKLHQREKELLAPYVSALLEESYQKFTGLYEFEPAQPLLFELIPSPTDFSVRSFGVPGIDFALGICFAKTFIALSPKAQEYQAKRFHWGAVTVHEFMHVITLQLSNFRVPRWFTEGASVYAEKLIRPNWGRELEMQIYVAYQQGKIQHLEKFCEKRGFDLVHTYLFSSLIIEYIHKKYGMDKIIAMLKGFGDRKKQSAVFQEVLGISIQEFDRQFFEYFEKEWITRIRIRQPVDRKQEPALRQRIKQNAQDAEALGLLSEIIFQKKELLEAQKLAQDAREIDPKNIAAHLTLGRIFYQKRRYQKAADYFTQALALGADYFDVHYKLAQIYLKTGEKDKAIPELQQAKKCFPQYVKYKNNPYYHLAQIYKENNETEKLKAELEAFFKIEHDHFYFKKSSGDPDAFLPRRELARIYARRKEYGKLISLLEDTVYLEPESLTLHAWLAKAARANKDYPRAIRSYRAVVFLLEKLDPGPKRDKKLSGFYCDLAEIHLVLKNKGKAVISLREAQKVYPDNSRIDQIKKQLNE